MLDGSAADLLSRKSRSWPALSLDRKQFRRQQVVRALQTAKKPRSSQPESWSGLLVRWWRPHERPEDVVQLRHHHDVVDVDLAAGEVVVDKDARLLLAPVREGQAVVEPGRNRIPLGNQLEIADPKRRPQRSTRHRLQTSDVDALVRHVDVTRPENVIGHAA